MINDDDDRETNPGRRSVMPTGLAHRVRALEDRFEALVADHKALRLSVMVGFAAIIADFMCRMWWPR